MTHAFLLILRLPYCAAAMAGSSVPRGDISLHRVPRRDVVHVSFVQQPNYMRRVSVLEDPAHRQPASLHMPTLKPVESLHA
eukprot:CAMPEP_0168453900 /NCGR_PEP_ID=MMETSP0228-20121227/49931_1 /TAXON_ID=133427 /ORGANISM="Protoceratium reticulatum, Strain CCCM 535 (=CCMP 1889)" /LENGTH=80 /DNA_ID=CAMNT_0008468645 /DNA_START=7 /DNA_END=247 /DNA_ORIENTATION=-